MSIRRPRLVGKVGKRLGQVAYLWSHPLQHRRCKRTIGRARVAGHRAIAFKYLGDYLALSLTSAERRGALAQHYGMLSSKCPPGFSDRVAASVLIWEKQVDHHSPLRIYLEPSRLAPMEGELQLRFAFHSDLFVMTFLFAKGKLFGSNAADVLFIGGAQGGVACRAETREASRLNGEIAPAAMLVIAAQAIAKAIGVHDIVAISDDLHISTGYAADQIKLDYERLWTDAGGTQEGSLFRLPIDPVPKPLAEIARTHRSRTRRKREAKAEVRSAINHRVGDLISPPQESRPKEQRRKWAEVRATRKVALAKIPAYEFS